MYIVIKEALNKNPVDPINRKSGKINNPSKIPRFFKIAPVIKNCIISVANPVHK